MDRPSFRGQPPNTSATTDKTTMASDSPSSAFPRTSFLSPPPRPQDLLQEAQSSYIENPLLSRPAPTAVPTRHLPELRLRRARPERTAPPRASFSLETPVEIAKIETERESLWPSRNHNGSGSVTSPTTASSDSSIFLPSATSGLWVCVYGYATRDQYNEILRRFSQYGHIVTHKGSCQPGTTNWIAIQYESRLQAEKALCHRNLQLNDGIFCGVFRLEDNDPKVLQTTSSLWMPPRFSALLTNGVSNHEKSGSDHEGLSERDILLVHEKEDDRDDRERSVCLRFVRWLLGVN